MKKILIAILLFTSIFAKAQTPTYVKVGVTLYQIIDGDSIPIKEGSHLYSAAYSKLYGSILDTTRTAFPSLVYNPATKKLYKQNINEPRDTIYVLAMGQSNSAGGAEDAIDTAFDSRLQAYDTLQNKWVTMRVGYEPFYRQYVYGSTEMSPSSQFFFGRKLAREKNIIVRVVNYAVGGVSIANWHDGYNRGIYLKDIIRISSAIGIPRYDLLIWDQGEANSGSTPDYYIRAWDSLKSALRSNSWFPNTTKIVAVGMPRIYQGAPAWDGIDQTLQMFDGNDDAYDFYGTTDSATVNKIAAQDGGIRIHFNSKGLQLIGEEIVYGIYTGKASSYRNHETQDEYGNLITNNKIIIGHGAAVPFRDNTDGSFLFPFRTNVVVSIDEGNPGRPKLASMGANTTGSYNSSFGAQTMVGNTTGFWNSAFGAQALFSNLTGGRNSAFGLQSLYGSKGSQNIGIGWSAGFNLTTGSFNVLIGSNLGTRISTLNNWMLFSDGSGTERFTVDPAGNFGIGKTDPTEKLDLLGNIKLTGSVKVDNSTTPATPVGGGILFVQGGALKFIGSSGTITVIANP